MRHRLRPVRPRRRARLQLTLATLVLPILGFAILVRLPAARAPLAEREATLAVNLRPQTSDAAAPEAASWTAPAMTLVAGLPRLAGHRELQLRLAGMIAGALALGVAGRLGTRLFAPRVGVATALLLLALPTGRALLGTELSVEPFYLVAMLASVIAMRNMPEARVAAVLAGIASGISLSLAGLDAAWLPLLGLVWLRMHQGLNPRSASVLLGTTALAAAASLLGGSLLAASLVGVPLATALPQATGYLDGSLLEPERALRELAFFAPLLALGLWTTRARWWRGASFRFLLVWLALAMASFLLGGAGVGAYVALLFLLTAVSILGLMHAGARLALPACAAAAVIGAVTWSPAAGLSEGQALDRWAIREAGRFIGRVIGAEHRVAASERAARRFAFYGERAVTPVEPTAGALARADYVILPREDFRSLLARRGSAEASGGTARTPRLARIAEFGGWVVARVEGTAKAAGGTSAGPAARGPIRLSFAPPK